MKNIRKIFKINFATYILILTFLLTGLIKNILLIYIIVIVHEIGHIFIARLLKYKIIKVEIYPMGGVTTIDKKVNTSIKEELLIASFGLFFQILLWLIMKILYINNIISINAYELFLGYNFTIFCFNLLPIIPLDGHYIFKTILEYIFPFKKSYYISFIISLIFIILFITYNMVYSLNNYLIISFLIYKIINSYKDFKYIYLKFLTERYLYDINYKKIKYENKLDLNLLKKDNYHYFKKNDRIISEKKLLKQKFY